MLGFLLFAALPIFARAENLGGNLLRFPIRASGGAPVVKSITKRQEEVATESQLNGYFYSIELGIGTPSQAVTVNFDTGSPELWINPICNEAEDPEFCESFGHLEESSTYVDLESQGTIVYGSGFVRFNYSYDYVAIGASRITQQIFGVASSSFFTNVGIMGASPDLSGWESEYPLVIDNLASQGFINSRAFSLDIRSIESDRGSVIFGGIDTRKYSGRLEKCPIIPADDSPDGYTRYWVNLDGIALVQGGKKTTIFSSPQKQAVLLDSGYTLSTLPGPLVEAIVADFPTAEPIENSPLYAVDCSVRDLDDTVDFAFGETVIKVPYKDFVWKRESDQACRLGVFQDDNFPVLGDSFLRAAYVVYDWDNRNIFVANNEDCGTQLVEIGSGPNAVPDLVGECNRSNSTTTAQSTSTTAHSASTATTSTSTMLPHSNATSVLTTERAHSSSVALSTSHVSSILTTERSSHTSVALSTSQLSYAAESYPTAWGTDASTSTVTVSNVYTITSCPPDVKDCPIGSVTTETFTSYTVCPPEDMHVPSHNGATPNDPGKDSYHGSQPNALVITKEARPQTVATYTIHATSICVGEDGCSIGASKVVEHIVTVTPVNENEDSSPTLIGGSSKPGNHLSLKHTAITVPADSAATLGVKPETNGSATYHKLTEDTAGGSLPLTAGAAWVAPSILALIAGGFVVAAL
ncbi:hypothetical protein FZEAL_1533 [Fusarium zealandicum]|uniref:Peptidase A1 domain-containing protein n=1 Tax=Fusarium zealandicum TaxID=1053134 RepID=A0A8H4UT56_9HYPO|nr:hypothetical protein FZEAL_1533 [Fusarium zealandicum]